MAEMSRADHLKAMIKGAETRMASGKCSDQNYAVLGRMRADMLVQLEALKEPAAKGEGSGSATVDEFTQRRRQRGA